MAAGFKQIKQYHKGKTKRAVTSYMGWTIKEKVADHMLDVSAEQGAYVLGIIWGMSSYQRQRGWAVSLRYPWVEDVVVSALAIRQYTKRLKPNPIMLLRDGVIDFIKDYGWVGASKADHFPLVDDLDKKAFIRGYIETHHTLNPYPALIIHGKLDFLAEIATVIAVETGIVIAPHTMRGNSAGLAYWAQKQVCLVNWLYGGAVYYNRETKDKFEGGAEAIAQRIKHKKSKLSPGEKRFLQLRSEGNTYIEISTLMGVSKARAYYLGKGLKRKIEADGFDVPQGRKPIPVELAREWLENRK